MISIIIANYNGVHFLRDCLDSLKSQSYQDIEILVVDNGSKDESVEFLKEHYPEVKIIQSGENLGFAGANNLGFKKAKGEYILFLNNDTKVDSFCLERLFNRISSKKNEIGVVFGKLLCMDEPKRFDAIGSYLTDYGFLYHIGFREIDRGQYDNLKYIFSPKGVCFLMPKELLLDIGVFDEDYFSYFEESDLFWRVWLSGKTIEFVPDAICYHKVGGTSTKLASSFIDYHSFKNRICTLIKNLELASLWRILIVHLIFCLVISFLYLCLLRFKNSFSILKALIWNLINIKATLKKRKLIQQDVRVLDDRKLFRKIKRDIPLSQFIQFTKVYLKRW